MLQGENLRLAYQDGDATDAVHDVSVAVADHQFSASWDRQVRAKPLLYLLSGRKPTGGEVIPMTA